MSTTTTNYGLHKPELTDAADITAMNSNWDKIDFELLKSIKYRGALEQGTDLNTVLESGSYNYTGTNAPTIVNTPVNGTGAHLHVFKAADYDGDSTATKPTIQLLTTTSVNYQELYWRKHASGEWTAWYKLINEDKLNTLVSVINNARIEITDNADLNDFKTVGCYRCTSNARTLTLTNCPTTRAFTMDVVSGTGWHTTVTADNGFVIQKIVDHRGGSWMRAVFANSGAIAYDPWQELYTSQNPPYTYGTTDLTAGTSTLETGKIHLVYE